MNKDEIKVELGNLCYEHFMLTLKAIHNAEDGVDYTDEEEEALRDLSDRIDELREMQADLEEG